MDKPIKSTQAIQIPNNRSEQAARGTQLDTENINSERFHPVVVSSMSSRARQRYPIGLGLARARPRSKQRDDVARREDALKGLLIITLRSQRRDVVPHCS